MLSIKRTGELYTGPRTWVSHGRNPYISALHQLCFITQHCMLCPSFQQIEPRANECSELGSDGVCVCQPVAVPQKRRVCISLFSRFSPLLPVGHMEVVRLLVSHGAEVVCKDKKGYTPLHAAASSGMIGVVKYLLDLGVEVCLPLPQNYHTTPPHPR